MTTHRSTFARGVSGLGAAAGCALLLACAQNPQPAPAPQTGAENATAQQPAAAAPKPTIPAPLIEPPDGKWLTDEQGRQYFLQEVPKVEGWYHWESADKARVRLWYGMLFDVASEDQDSIDIKIYKPDPAVDAANPRPPGLSEAERAAIAATYRNTTGAVDRLTFEPFGRGLPNQGQWRNGFKVADMNGDGNPDIVHGPARKGDGLPNVFLGDGKGSWQRAADLRFPRLGYDYGDIAVADFNGDGRQDLAFAVHLRGLLVLVADGPSGFKEWSSGVDFHLPGHGDAGSGFTSRAVESADWNGDGRPDLIALGEGPQMAVAGRANPQFGGGAFGVVVFLNQGDGSWIRRDEFDQGARVFGDDLAVQDLDGDRRLDIALGSSVLGHKELLRMARSDGGWSRAELEGVRPRAYVGAIDAADFDGDGRSDLAIGYLSREGDLWRTGIDVLLGQPGNGWRRQGVAVEESRDWLTALDSGDLDGDGHLDIAAATGDGEVWIFLGRGDGSFLRETSPEIPPSAGGCRGYDVQIVNLDGDPAEELVAAFAGEPSALFAPTQCLEQGAMAAWKPRPHK